MHQLFFSIKKKGTKMKALRIVVIILCGIVVAACGRAYSNVQTLITSDCGVSWSLVKVGETLPAQVGPCSYKVTVPDYPLQGETKFKTSFKNRVLAEVEVSYDYSVVDGIAFIGEAKYLGRANSDGNDSTNSAAMYESAENSVIDKRIREAATEALIKEDIVEFSQSEFEDHLLTEVNKVLASKGVKINFLSFVPIPEEQTRLAIDMMTAMKIYDSKGLTDLGKQVSVSRAGATKITVASTTTNAPPSK